MLLRTAVRLLRRAVVTVVGVAILVLGAVMLVAPGPGLLVLALGLFTLGFEYEWARRRLDSVQRKVADVAERTVAKPWSTVGSVLAAVALIAAGIGLGLVEGLPASGWWTGGSLAAAGLVALGTIVVSLRQARAVRRAEVPAPRTDAPVPRPAGPTTTSGRSD